MRGYRFYIISGLLILLIFVMSTMTVNATESKRLQHDNEYYEVIEEEYKMALRSELSDMGYRNAGITMTKVFYEDGAREYTVKLHHKRMQELTLEEQEILLSDLSEVAFADSDCRVCLKFL